MTKTKVDYSSLLTRTQVQERYPMLKKKRLEKLACTDEGPEFIKIAGRCWYAPIDIEAFLERTSIKPDLPERQKRRQVQQVFADAHRVPPRKKLHKKYQIKASAPAGK